MARIKKGDLALDGISLVKVLGFTNFKGKRHARIQFIRTGNPGLAPVAELKSMNQE